jgi:predicted nucleic acid-binding protein
LTLVADASVVVPALVDAGSAGETARSALATPDVVAPTLLDVEVVSALRGRVRGGKLSVTRAQTAIGILRVMPLERYDVVPLLERVWELRDNLTAYDATYVALAEAVGATLVTGDERLVKSSGTRCEIRLLAVP